MSETIFGIDFGTTNSLAAVAVGGRALALVDLVTGRPHPSVGRRSWPRKPLRPCR